MSQLFASDDQNAGVLTSASAVPMSIQGLSPLRLTGGGNGKPPQYTCYKNLINCVKGLYSKGNYFWHPVINHDGKNRKKYIYIYIHTYIYIYVCMYKSITFSTAEINTLLINYTSIK